MRHVGARALAAMLPLVGACFDGRPPAWAPVAPAAGVRPEACQRAHAFLARAPELFAQGKLDRTARVLTRAEDLCPAEAEPTWALRVQALADLGRVSEAVQLAARIERSSRATDADRAAARQARASVAERASVTALRGSRRDDPERFDPSDVRRAEGGRLSRSAAAASRAGDHAAAERLFLDAWKASSPDPAALAAAGVEAHALGNDAEAQRLWDRAAFDDAAIAARPVLVDGAPRAVGPRTVAWSPLGHVAVGGDHAIDVFDGALHPVLRFVPKDTVLALAFAADGGALFVALESGAIQVFDTVTGRAAGSLAWHRTACRALVVSPDGARLASASDEGVAVWDLRTGATALTITRAANRSARGASPSPSLVAFDATGSTLAVADEEASVTTYDVPSGAPRAHFKAPRGAPLAIGFVGDAHAGPAAVTVVTTTGQQRFEIDAAAHVRAKPAVHGASQVAAIAGELAAVVKADGVVAVLDGAPVDVARVDLHGGVTGIAASASGEVAVVYRDRSIGLLPVRAKASGAAAPTAARWMIPRAPVRALAAGGPTVAVAADERVVVWTMPTSTIRSSEVPDVRALALAHDGQLLAMGLGNHQVELRDLGGRKPDAFETVRGAVTHVSFSNDGARLVATTDAPSVEAFAEGKTDEHRALGVASGVVRSARFSPDGSTVVVAAESGLTLWQLASREGVRLPSFGSSVGDAFFTPDGAGLAAIGSRGELLFGKLATPAAKPQTVLVPARARAVALDKDGSLVTLESDGGVVQRSATGKVVHRYVDNEAPARALALLGDTPVAGYDDGSIRVFRGAGTAPSAILEMLPGLPDGALAGVARSPRGHFDVIGPDAARARARMRCVIGAVFFPIEVCAEQYAVKDLLAMTLAGADPAEAEP